MGIIHYGGNKIRIIRYGRNKMNQSGSDRFRRDTATHYCLFFFQVPAGSRFCLSTFTPPPPALFHSSPFLSLLLLFYFSSFFPLKLILFLCSFFLFVPLLTSLCRYLKHLTLSVNSPSPPPARASDVGNVLSVCSTSKFRWDSVTGYTSSGVPWLCNPHTDMPP